MGVLTSSCNFGFTFLFDNRTSQMEIGNPAFPLTTTCLNHSESTRERSIEDLWLRESPRKRSGGLEDREEWHQVAQKLRSKELWNSQMSYFLFLFFCNLDCVLRLHGHLDWTWEKTINPMVTRPMKKILHVSHLFALSLNGLFFLGHLFSNLSCWNKLIHRSFKTLNLLQI